ncbi:bifunctional phosphopantothenoylcysteine decarboxylase/phosphopantothenate--cysteine ligase CoaBC [Spirulina major CS-329]|uniref:bifunctional phosphopantothenoylcysteine decarboxylase/phosphopantothenate--cysteine ligase CoaBC n=1 Tax=Spirulina TaxID=1154 RepID=UPI002330EF2C|nr:MULTISPECIES: bifunctional phosphopantothenoylcysteine decarboxylase/phosphopantothenate--cysteine ligase CoaBC [Spirulina]MDB9494277.1 bifunctional phosphopantothenoylcysteine decarboxylase/phosphopantothenate--cysteine ligase CoaBC [Spirulina subsalsa CS-330]MDB9503161.1 bifunctional phosphopantothenoylcysteine decarboxylase/phosphopantothenate--cysteine ligase CoaBC [Spirulina major CS-329]
MGHQILIGIGGGIAAYKVCTVISTLAQTGVEVRVILTTAATQFITPLTVATLSRHPAYTDGDFWQANRGRPLHIELGEWADVCLIAPLTAHTLAKLAHGFADNLLTNTVLASRCPILLAPAMNTDMWEQATVQENWQRLLTQSRYHGLATGVGRLACDRVGAGRMAEPDAILQALESLRITQGHQPLQGKRIIITAGGTREYLDPVRFIGNPATGKMGIALAQAALSRGAIVTLIHGPGTFPTGLGESEHYTGVAVTTAAEMAIALDHAFPAADWVIMAAAVADVRPANYAPQKLAKADLPAALPLAPVPDLIATLSQHKQPHQKLIGFAAQTGDIVPPAIAKLHRKGLDAIVANAIDQPQGGFGSDQNQGIWITATQQIPLPLGSKLAMAHRILEQCDRL